MSDKGRESKLDRARDGVAAGAEHVKQVTTRVAAGTRDTASRARQIVREAEPDEELKENVRTGTQRAMNKAGEAVTGAAPAVGRVAEYAVGKVGAALRFVGRPLGAILGPIAGTVGGWWNKASELKGGMPAEVEAGCREHFATVLVVDGMSYDHAHTGYVLGYMAGCNPDYRGRAFEDVEPDLRHGFTNADAEYQALREFARYGFSLQQRR